MIIEILSLKQFVSKILHNIEKVMQIWSIIICIIYIYIYAYN